MAMREQFSESDKNIARFRRTLQLFRSRNPLNRRLDGMHGGDQ
jgi:hypothetical protein